jgi:MFS transporter, MHS family, alpha-ketoglutarate permease
MSHVSQPAATLAPPAFAGAPRKSHLKSLVASGVGNVLEWYEWSAYAVFSPFIAAALFEKSDPASGLLATLGVFAVGFLVRPIGGIVFGIVADRRGRKFVMVTTMLLMSGASLMIALIPDYGAIGIFASLLLLFARLVQGFAHGGESATSTTYVAEIAPSKRRGLWSCVVFAAIIGGTILAYALGGGITTFMSAEEVGNWGWRIPFFLGALLAIVALIMRRKMDESDVFEEDQASNALNPVHMSRGKIVRTTVLMIFLTAGITCVHYTWGSYASTYAITSKGMDAKTAYWVSLAAQAVALVSLPFWGWLSDKIGRRPLVLFFAAASIVLTIPLTSLISNEGWTLFVASGLSLMIWAIPGSIFAAMMAENFPTRIRTRGIGFAYSMAVALFGGTAPYLNQLFNSMNASWMSSVYIMLLCVATGIAALRMKETKGIDLKDAGR